MNETLTLTAQVTPNPNTLKFVLDRKLIDRGSIDFQDPEKGKNSPVVKALFEINGIEGVLIGTNFVSVTKSADVDWTHVAESITSTIKKELSENEEPIEKALIDATEDNSNDSEVEKKIKQILDTEIRPAVAMDGGDITFDRYEDGTLFLQLQGACSTCPSSVMTLKMGIENRLKEDIPELQEVVQSGGVYDY